MCVVNSDKGKYEVLVFDTQQHLICNINFTSISTVCRFLEEFDFEFGDVEVIKKKDQSLICVPDLLEVWNTYFVEEF